MKLRKTIGLCMCGMAALLAGCLKETPLPEAPPFQHTYGGSRNEVAGGLAAMPDGGYVLVGGTQNDRDGNYDLYIVKIDADGKLVFAASEGEDGYDEVGWKVIPADNGEYAVFGTRSVGNNGRTEFVMTMLNADLKVIGQTVSPTSLPNTGFTPQNASFFKLQGGGFFVGFTSDNYPIALRFGVDGRLIDEEAYAGYDGGKYNHVFCKAADGSIYAAVTSTDYNVGSSWIDVLRFDAFGNYQGSQTITGLYTSNARVFAAAATSDHRLVISLRSETSSQQLVAFVDSSWVVADTIDRQGRAYYNLITELPGGRLLFTGFDAVEYDYGVSDDFRTALLDSSGNSILTISYGGQATDRLRECLLAPTGQAVLFGETQSYGAGGSDLFLIFFTQ